MSDVLNQNEKYTILSSEHGDSITLFWHQYMDKKGIQSWYFLQESWYFGKRIARERSYPPSDDTLPNAIGPTKISTVLPVALSITVSVLKGVVTPVSSIKPVQARTSGTKVLLDEV